MKIEFGKQFWEIREEMFKPALSQWANKEIRDNVDYIHYHTVSAVYVYSINKIWDGSETFDVCPVDFSKKENKDKSWGWRRSVKYDEIGKIIFETKEDCDKYYKETYSEKQRTIYDEKKQLRLLQKG